MELGPSDQDPGWGSPAKVLLGLVLPGVAMRRAKTAPNALVALRAVFVSFVMAILLYGVVLIFIVSGDDGDASLGVGTATAGVGAVGFVCILLSATIGGELRCGSLEELLGSYRTRFFLRVAFAELAALVGFVATFLAESLTPYLLGAAFALVGFARLAPTRSRLQSEQDELRRRGCAHGIYDALRGATLGG